LAIVVVLAAVEVWSGSTPIQTTHVFGSDSGSGRTDWWPLLSK
jgi:hypothetical protein